MDFNRLFFSILNEADEEEDKKDKKEEKEKSEKEDKSVDDGFNDLLGEDNPDDDIEDEDFMDDGDDPESSDSEYEDLLGDDNEDKKSDNTSISVKVSVDDGGSIYEKAAKVGYAYTLVANNMKHIHLNACGDKFREIHTLCDELYHHFMYLSDEYFELAAQSSTIELDNPSRSNEHCEGIAIEQEKCYGFKDALEAITTNLEAVTKYLDDLRTAASTLRQDIASKIDDELSYINKQSKYFIRKSLSDSCCPPSTAMEAWQCSDLI